MTPTVAILLGIVLGAGGMLIFWLLGRQRLVSEVAKLTAERDAALRSVSEQRALLYQTQDQVRETFAALSREALKDNRADFMLSADSVLGPVRDTLSRVQAQLLEVDRAREGTHHAVAQQLKTLASSQEQLRAATEGLSSSLRSPNIRGKWGEIQLRRILELAGMLAQCDFMEKESSTDADGAGKSPTSSFVYLVARRSSSTPKCQLTRSCRRPRPRARANGTNA